MIKYNMFFKNYNVYMLPLLAILFLSLLFIQPDSAKAQLDYDGAAVFIPSGSGGLTFPQGIVCDSEGRVYVSSEGSDQVLRYNGSGDFLGVFASGGGLSDPYGIEFGPDGSLLCSKRRWRRCESLQRHHRSVYR